MSNIWTFETPTEISKESSLLDYAETYLIDGFYQPPISLTIFDKAIRSNAYCGSALQAKRNILMSTLICSDLITRQDAESAIHDYLACGNMYLYKIMNVMGDVLALRYLPALYMRVGKGRKKYAFLKNYMDKDIYSGNKIIHLKQLDMRQEIYGMPEWFGAISSILLSESATLFRRKYYKNGAHAGFLLYVNSPNISDKEDKIISEQLNSLSGLGNFKNLFINAKGQDTQKPELIPISQIDAKDEFLNIKNATRDDILVSHRVPPQLIGVIPANVGGFGDAPKAAEVFYANEIAPLQDKLLNINQLVGQTVFSLQDYYFLKEKEAEK